MAWPLCLGISSLEFIKLNYIRQQVVEDSICSVSVSHRNTHSNDNQKLDTTSLLCSLISGNIEYIVVSTIGRQTPYYQPVTPGADRPWQLPEHSYILINKAILYCPFLIYPLFRHEFL